MVWASSAIFELAHQRVNGDDQFFLRELPAGQSSQVSQGVARKTFFDGALKISSLYPLELTLVKIQHGRQMNQHHHHQQQSRNGGRNY